MGSASTLPTRRSDLDGNGVVLLGRGNGAFAPVQRFLSGSPCRAATVGPFAADDKPDSAAARAGSDAVVLLIHE